MDQLTREELNGLLAESQGPCVSIYLATHRAGNARQQDPARLKNLLRDAGERLVALGLRSPEAIHLLEPAHALLDDGTFWRRPGDGLAVFRSSQAFRSYRLPVAFEDLVVVGRRFHIKPLLPVLTDDGRFFIVAFSEAGVRLLDATRHSFHEVEIPSIPRAGSELLEDDAEGERRRSDMTPTSSGRDRGHPVFGGIGVAGSENKDRIFRYCREIDHGLRSWLRDQSAPLVLAGVEHYFPIYREANTYRHLLDDGVSGNPDWLNDQELHRRACAVVQPHLERARQEAAAQYKELAATPRAAKQLTEIVPAADQGRVQFVFVAARAHQWGSFHPADGKVEIRSEPQPGDEDLLDRVAFDTWSNRGMVYVVDQPQMPDTTPVAAVFRY